MSSLMKNRHPIIVGCMKKEGEQKKALHLFVSFDEDANTFLMSCPGQKGHEW